MVGPPPGTDVSEVTVARQAGVGGVPLGYSTRPSTHPRRRATRTAHARSALASMHRRLCTYLRAQRNRYFTQPVDRESVVGRLRVTGPVPPPGDTPPAARPAACTPPTHANLELRFWWLLPRTLIRLQRQPRLSRTVLIAAGTARIGS